MRIWRRQVKNWRPRLLPTEIDPGQWIETLRTAGWLQEEERSDWQKGVFFDPNGSVPLQTLRRMAYSGAAIFSGKRGDRGFEHTMQIGSTSSALTMDTVAMGCFVRQREMQPARPLGGVERRHY
jgi:hypothetical protein